MTQSHPGPRIANASINASIDEYWSLYVEQGELSFELSEEEYTALAAITKEYHQASLDSDFDGVSWARQAGERGMFQLEKSAFVFNFLMLTWHTRVAVSVSHEEPWIIFTARRESATAD